MLLKTVHLSCVAASYSLFALRGVWMLRDSALLHQRWVKITPHVVDTALLASAIALTIAARQYPLVDAWLSAKVLGLLLYIMLGTVALKRGKTRRIRLVAWIAAQAVFFYIIAVAATRKPLPWV